MFFDLHTHRIEPLSNVSAIYNCALQATPAGNAVARELVGLGCSSPTAIELVIDPSNASFHASASASCSSLLTNLTDSYPLHHCSASLHPWYLTPTNAAKQLAWLKQMVHTPHVVAIGEVGLDKLRGPDFEFQQEIFCKIIEIAESAQLPVIIHQVKAMNELVLLHKKLRPTTPWILHGFRGKKELALSALQQGFYLSYGKYYQPEALKNTPIHRLFLETDTADIAIQTLYDEAAKLRNCSVDELCMQLLENSAFVFSITYP